MKKRSGGSTRSTEKEDDAFRSMDLDSKSLSFENEGEWGNDFTVEVKGMGSQSSDDGEIRNHNDMFDTSRQSSGKRKYIHSEMLSYKQQGSYDLPEDVYSFITVAPVCSSPFLFASTVICTKYLVYITLLSRIKFSEFSIKTDEESRIVMGTISNDEAIAIAVKFFLIPVTVAMQEDLMAVYAGLANARYDPKVKEVSQDATNVKFHLAYLLQLIDGLLSLSVNFLKMFSTPEILDVFLNFAALHFLQDIDDVFYALVEKGFFGDDMEHMATVCKQISWPRRTGSTEFSHFLTNLDSILFFLTFLICVALYVLITYILIARDM